MAYNEYEELSLVPTDKDTTGHRMVNVSLRDADGNLITSTGGGTGSVNATIYDGANKMAVSAAGSASVTVTNAAGASAVNVQDGGNSLTVDAVNLDIRDLTQATDAVAIYGSDDGGTTKRIIKTDSGGAVQVDLEVASVTVTNASGASAVNVQDGGNSLTVDGSVTVTQSTNANLKADVTSNAQNIATETTVNAIKTSVELIGNSVDGNYLNTNLNLAGTDAPTGGGTEAGSLRVTVASDSTGLLSVDDNGGSLTVDNTSIDGPGKPVVDSYGNLPISAAANTANQSLISAPGANKQIWVYGIQFAAGTGAGSYSIQDEDDTAITGVVPVAQYSGLVETPKGNFAMPLWKVATNKALEVDTSVCDIKGSIQYGIISV